MVDPSARSASAHRRRVPAGRPSPSPPAPVRRTATPSRRPRQVVSRPGRASGPPATDSGAAASRKPTSGTRTPSRDDSDLDDAAESPTELLARQLGAEIITERRVRPT